MSFTSRCDCCCLCGAFCSNAPYCGRDMWFVVTFSGASNGSSGDCVNCAADLNVAGALDNTGGSTSVSAATWNATRPAYSGRDAKDGTRVCTWVGGFTQIDSACSAGAANLNGATITVYYGTDDKWYMIFDVLFVDYAGYQCLLAGEQVFSGGGAAMDCGEPGEMTPTFSLTITLTRYDESGTADVGCVPTSSVLVEGDPQ